MDSPQGGINHPQSKMNHIFLFILQEDLYMSECGPDQPLRCYAGDLSGRLGTISIGVERQVFSDSNLPLGSYRLR